MAGAAAPSAAPAYTRTAGPARTGPVSATGERAPVRVPERAGAGASVGARRGVGAVGVGEGADANVVGVAEVRAGHIVNAARRAPPFADTCAAGRIGVVADADGARERAPSAAGR